MLLCFATNNKNKLNELQASINNSIRLVSLEEIGCHEEIPETEDTIEGNSLLKAQYIWDKYQIPTIADDTGLEVDFLEGKPGVYSARYAGEKCSSEDNMQKLLNEMGDTANREASFKTIITYINNNEVKQFRGICEGDIRKEKTGVKGFGYDPIFQPKGFNVTFAEMSMEEKNKISHRGKAVRKLIDFIRTL